MPLWYCCADRRGEMSEPLDTCYRAAVRAGTLPLAKQGGAA